MKRLLLLLLLTGCETSEKGDSGAVEYQSEINYAEEMQIEEMEKDTLV